MALAQTLIRPHLIQCPAKVGPPQTPGQPWGFCLLALPSPVPTYSQDFPELLRVLLLSPFSTFLRK